MTFCKILNKTEGFKSLGFIEIVVAHEILVEKENPMGLELQGGNSWT